MVAAAAESLTSQSLTEHAFEALLDVEPVIFETTALLNAASVVNRTDREKAAADQGREGLRL